MTDCQRTSIAQVYHTPRCDVQVAGPYGAGHSAARHDGELRRGSGEADAEGHFARRLYGDVANCAAQSVNGDVAGCNNRQVTPLHVYSSQVNAAGLIDNHIARTEHVHSQSVDL